jgi:hypothetical protein
MTEITNIYSVIINLILNSMGCEGGGSGFLCHCSLRRDLCRGSCMLSTTMRLSGPR